MENGKVGVSGEEGPQGIMMYKSPSKGVIYSRAIDLSHLENRCNIKTSPGPSGMLFLPVFFGLGFSLLNSILFIKYET